MENLPENSGVCAPDIHIYDQGELYLIRQRIDNLRQQVMLSVDELMELHELEGFYAVFSEDEEAVPHDLGIPSNTDRLIAALEGKRVNRYNDEEYDGGDPDEEDESVSSINRYHQELFQKSRLNLKSLNLLSAEKKPIWNNHNGNGNGNGNGKKLMVYDLYELAPPKFTFPQYLMHLWQKPENEAMDALKKLSPVKQWELQEQWKKYLQDRENKTPAPFQQMLLRLRDLTVSPIYDDMQEIGDEHYRLSNGIELRFTDKTGIFTIPMSEFDDIERKPVDSHRLGQAAFLQGALTLPEYAHDRKRFFRKNGTVEELTRYLGKLGVDFSSKQVTFLNDLVRHGALRLYREVLELPDRDEVRGYFLNVRKGFQNYNRGYIRHCIRERFQESDRVLVRQVTQFSTWYPEWMRKLGGLIVEDKNGAGVAVPKPLQISVDYRLPRHSYKRERMLMPSNRLFRAKTAINEWERMFVAEMRTAYRANPQAFKDYAENTGKKNWEIKCSCNNGGHDKYCPVPLLEEIFRKINDNHRDAEK